LFFCFYKILDVQGVLQVITVLEKYPITKESLEVSIPNIAYSRNYILFT